MSRVYLGFVWQIKAIRNLHKWLCRGIFTTGNLDGGIYYKQRPSKVLHGCCSVKVWLPQTDEIRPRYGKHSLEHTLEHNYANVFKIRPPRWICSQQFPVWIKQSQSTDWILVGFTTETVRSVLDKFVSIPQRCRRFFLVIFWIKIRYNFAFCKWSRWDNLTLFVNAAFVTLLTCACISNFRTKISKLV